MSVALFASLVVLVTAAAPAPAAPASAAAATAAASSVPSEDKAKTFFQAGAQAYDNGRFDDAAQAFDEAYKLAKLPAILFSMAQAERKQFYVSRKREYLDRAQAHYRAYLESNGVRRVDAADALGELEAIAARLSPLPAPPPVQPVEPPKPVRVRLTVTTQAPKAQVELDGKAAVEAPFIGELDPGRHRVRVLADGYLSEEREVQVDLGSPVGLDLPLHEKPGLLEVEAPAGSEVFVDGAKVAEVPLARPMELPSGPHSVTLIQRGMRPWTKEVTLQRGQATAVTAALERTNQRLVSFGVLGASAVALLGGAACTGVAFDRQDAAKKVLREQQVGNLSEARLSDYNRALKQRDQWRTAAQASFGTGAALLTVGGLLYLLDWPVVTSVARKPETPAGPAVPVEVGAAPLLLPGGGGLSVAGRF
ncbi:MAG: PEGA domain-containing protein [Myxococcales bacterium]